MKTLGVCLWVLLVSPLAFAFEPITVKCQPVFNILTSKDEVLTIEDYKDRNTFTFTFDKHTSFYTKTLENEAFFEGEVEFNFSHFKGKFIAQIHHKIFKDNVLCELKSSYYTLACGYYEVLAGTSFTQLDFIRATPIKIEFDMPSGQKRLHSVELSCTFSK